VRDPQRWLSEQREAEKASTIIHWMTDMLNKKKSQPLKSLCTGLYILIEKQKERIRGIL